MKVGSISTHPHAGGKVWEKFHKTFLELRSRMALRHYPKQLKRKNLVLKLHTSSPSVTKLSESSEILNRFERIFFFLIDTEARASTSDALG